MKLSIFSMYDKKAETYANPVMFEKPLLAQRAIENLLMDGGDSELHRHPEDFTLFHIGYFDPDTAAIEVISPVAVINLHEAAARVKAAREA